MLVGSTQQDLLSGDLEVGEDEKDDMALLNEIFDSPSTGTCSTSILVYHRMAQKKLFSEKLTPPYGFV